MSAPFSENCSKCKFSRLDEETRMTCRKAGPQSLGTPVPQKGGEIVFATFSWWPSVKPTDFCAGFEQYNETY